MKTIINGKRFDTEKATLVGEASYGNGRGDFSYWEAGLYRTPRSKQFFLAGAGGPMTQFATHHADRSRSGGSGIIPLTKYDALAWAEQYLTVDAVTGAQARSTGHTNNSVCTDKPPEKKKEKMNMIAKMTASPWNKM